MQYSSFTEFTDRYEITGIIAILARTFSSGTLKVYVKFNDPNYNQGDSTDIQPTKESLYITVNLNEVLVHETNGIKNWSSSDGTLHRVGGRTFLHFPVFRASALAKEHFPGETDIVFTESQNSFLT